MSVEDLESAISRLSGEELARFTEWFENFMADRWDSQIEEDIKASRFVCQDKEGKERQVTTEASGETFFLTSDTGHRTAAHPSRKNTLEDYQREIQTVYGWRILHSGRN
jgi:hypothetical protein